MKNILFSEAATTSVNIIYHFHVLLHVVDRMQHALMIGQIFIRKKLQWMHIFEFAEFEMY